MNIDIIKSEKDEIELNLDNQTIAEVLRVYLYEQGVNFAAWKREHPSKPILFKIKSSSKTVKKVVSDAVASIKKDCEKINSILKK
jgi:DNA-directed RNA polymerase subunit L